MANATMTRSASSGALLGTTGNSILACSNGNGRRATGDSPLPKVPMYLSVNGLTKRRKLPKSTGNLHAYMAEDYTQVNWPLPKMFGQEKYGFSLIDVEVKGRKASRDRRFVKECGQMSKKMVNELYDQQIIDLEWRNTYKLMLDAEHREATLPKECVQKTKDILRKEVNGHKEKLLALQEQKDMYMEAVKSTGERCDSIKATIKKEAELDELREYMEGSTRSRITTGSSFWRTKFNIKSKDKTQ
eukprot:TRINITY_DN16654_c0_g1_i1.p1 TRINITY_DN16654_c0_g1~~TRINITY_DN16654_c0_g1_i1.p1  ORF type:complete len:269 (+),score=60.23 TRINITY_DN16654_c0_g1_i1:76-807(+)